MQYFTEKRFKKKAVMTVLLLCTLFSAVRSAISFVLYGGVESELLNSVLSFVADSLGYFSVFAGYAIISYTVFLCGTRHAAEWLAAIIVGYGLSYFVILATGSIGFGLVLSVSVASVLATVLFMWLKSCRAVPAAIVITYFIPYVSALMLLTSASVSQEELVSSIIFEFMNLGFDILVLIIVMVISGIFRNRAILKGNGSADISLGNNFFPKDRPVLKAILTIDIVYTVIALINPIISAVEEISEYGMPVNSRDVQILVFPFVELIWSFVLGYIVMIFTARLMEKHFSNEEN